MSVGEHDWKYQPKPFLFLTRLTTKKYTRNFTYNMYWYQHTFQTQKVFVQNIQGAFSTKMFVILQSGITNKIESAHRHWNNLWQHLGTRLITYQANPHLIKRELLIIGAYCWLRHILVIVEIIS